MSNKLHFSDYVEHVLSFLCQFPMPCVIIGDVNKNMLSGDTAAKKFAEIIHSFACTNLITEATKITKKSATLLDICVTNIHSQDCIAGLLTVNLSDHLPVFCLLPNTQVKTQNHGESLISQHQWRRLRSFAYICTHIQSIDWACMFEQGNPNAAYEAFFEKFKASYKQAFPVTS